MQKSNTQQTEKSCGESTHKFSSAASERHRSAVPEDKQDVLVGPVAAAGLLKVGETGAANSWSTRTHTNTKQDEMKSHVKTLHETKEAPSCLDSPLMMSLRGGGGGGRGREGGGIC